MEKKEIRVRFAPSPTGYMHIGNLRTALYNWLHARHVGGTFVLRIEDTDRTRHNEGAIDVIVNGLNELGLNFDEGPYFQSERLEIYNKYANQLMEAGLAYKSDRGEAEKGEAVILKKPTDSISWVDIIKGKITIASEEMLDLVIIKSDGYPTYNFACAVDDHEMNISRVLRGDDHISNTPKQIGVCNALGFEPPEFGHFPMILGMDGQKLSKRHGAVKITDFVENGYFPHTVINFIALLGWSPGEDREIMTISEMVDLFTLDRVRSTASRFDYEKLSWMNGDYIRRSKPEDMYEGINKALNDIGIVDRSRGKEWLLDLIKLYQERFRTFPEFAQSVGYFFQKNEELRYLPKAVKKVLMKPNVTSVLEKSLEVLEKTEFTIPALEEGLRNIATSLEVGFGKVAQPIRVAVTATNKSAELFGTLVLMGKDTVISRIQQAISHIANDSFPLLEVDNG